MKTILRYLPALLAAAILLLTVGCGAGNQSTDITNDTAQTDAIDSTQLVVTFNEPDGASYQSKGGWETTVNSVKIQFTSDITEDERITAVAEITRLVALVDEQLGAVSAPCEIRIRKGSYTPWSYDHILYIGYDNLRTQEFTVGLGQMLFGHKVNYGLCYGFGVALAQEAGYPTENTSVAVERAVTLRETSPYHLDMNYACFVSAYADEETLLKVKTLAIDFYQSLTQDKQRELLTNYSNALYCEYLNDYLSAHGQDPYDNSDLEGIFFYPCGSQMRLAWEDPNAVYYLFDSYAVKYSYYDNLHNVDDYLNSGYENFRYLVSCYNLQTEEMERIAGHLEANDKEAKIDVLFVRDGTWERISNANYSFEDNTIRLYAYNAYSHEYIHYLTRGASHVGWLLELLPNYYSLRAGDPRVFWEMDCTKLVYENLTPGSADKKRYALYTGLKEHMDHPFDWSSPQDVNELKDATLVISGNFDLKASSGAAAAQESFARYLAAEYGEEAMLQAVFYDKSFELFGKSWDELISDWQEKLISEYSWILQYTKGS